MKLFLRLIALLPIISSSTPHSHELPEKSILNNPNKPIQAPSDKASKRSPQNGPNANYNPSSLSPLSNSGISSWSDNGRSETLDNQPGWITCPTRYLNCRKCPRDPRCPSPSSPKHSSTPKRPRPSLPPPEQGEMAALTGPQLAGLGVTDYEEKARCSVNQCAQEQAGCGKNAVCVGGYCACPRNLKGSSGSEGRGWKYPEALTVFVDAGVACDVPCQKRFCAEVERIYGCFEGTAAEVNGSRVQGQGPSETGAGGQNELESQSSSSTGHGAVQVPGAGGGDSSVGETV